LVVSFFSGESYYSDQIQSEIFSLVLSLTVTDKEFHRIWQAYTGEKKG